MTDPVSRVRAYERLWRSDVTDEDVDRLLHSAFVVHTPAEKGTGREELPGGGVIALLADPEGHPVGLYRPARGR